jgi:hypothetical protein
VTLHGDPWAGGRGDEAARPRYSAAKPFEQPIKIPETCCGRRPARWRLAVRLHGSKHTQDLLKEVQGAEQMQVLADGSLPPVLVLNNQSTGKANNSQCAD